MMRRFDLSAAFLRILFPIALLLPLVVVGGEDGWLLVDTDRHTLQLFDGERRVLRFEGISIGRGGSGYYRLKGGERTPLGKFRVAWVNADSRYRFFIGLDYPRREHAKRAFENGDIDDADRQRILRAIYAGRLPPQDTPLGGQIGIHGLGRADPGLHEMADWTRGCVAVTNEQIDLLRRHVYIGMAVVIR